MSDNIVDFKSKKEGHEIQRKEAKVDAMRQAFRSARGESEPKADKSQLARLRKSRKSKKK